MTGERRPLATNALLAVYITVLAAGAGALASGLHRAGATPPGRSSMLALPVIGALLVAAEYLFVRFRVRGETNALNLVEAALAPLLFAFTGPVAMATVAASHAVGDALRRNTPMKTVFNMAQWTLAAGTGALVLAGMTDERGITGHTVLALVAAQAAVAAVNHLAFTLVLSIAHRASPRRILFTAVLVPGWALPWILNSLVGALFVLAYAAHPAAVVLFPVPLVVLHLAYRGYAGARSDRVRLAGLHRAAQTLAEPLDPHEAIEPFLREVAACFEARAAALVLQREDGRLICRFDQKTDGYAETFQPSATRSLEGALLDEQGPARVTGSAARRPYAGLLAAGGWSDCLSAPLIEGNRTAGSLLIYDQAGLEGFEAGELAVVEALARETAGTLAKGRLLETILDERRKLAEIVGSTSDGILTIDNDGIVRAWNEAMEWISGVDAAEIVDRPRGLATFLTRTADGAPVDLSMWSSGEPLPAELRITGKGGRPVRLSCSYSEATDAVSGTHTLIVVVRDVTPQFEMQKLQERVGRLAEAEAAQRSVVEQLQQAVKPPRPAVAGVELGVSYLSSDPSAPTGGDLYDWRVLPGGDLHLAVVDVLGHGVGATQDAIAVVHTLRLLALQGCDLQFMVRRADELLQSQDRELVATVIVARFSPSDGTLHLAGGGHPPPLLLSGRNGVRPITLRGGPIGWPNAGSDMVCTITLDPRDAIVLYTDGLVESRRDIITGTESLARYAAEAIDLPAEALAAELVRRALTDAERRDDSLALVLRRVPVSAVPSSARWRITPDRGRVHEIRGELGRWLTERGIGGENARDLEIIAGELLANASAAAKSVIGMHVEVEPGTVRIEVEDDGGGRVDLPQLGLHQPDLRAEDGRGLFIVRSLADDVTVLSTPEGTIIRCVKMIRPSIGLAGTNDDRESADA